MEAESHPLLLKILSIFFWEHYQGKLYKGKIFKDTETQIRTQLSLKAFLSVSNKSIRNKYRASIYGEMRNKLFSS